MARTKTGYTNLTVTVPQDVADRLDDIHWRVRREVADILVDGKFILAEKDVKLRFRGSRNQRILELQESLKENRPVHSRYENPIKHHY